MTGIDRVEAAYLEALISSRRPLWGVVRTRFGLHLLDAQGVSALRARLDGGVPWGRPGVFGALRRRLHPMRRRAEADARRLCVLRSRDPLRIARALPKGCAYVNVGHTNLGAGWLRALRDVAGARVSVMIHDTIPLDHPGWQRPGTVTVFRERLRAALAHADTIIANSAATERDVRRWAAEFGFNPETMVAPLGVTPLRPVAGELPEGLPPEGKYFVCPGTIEPRKNHRLLLDVWEELARDADPDELPNLVIAGRRGWANEEVFDRLDALAGMGGPVIEVSGLSDGALAGLIQGARAVLFPSLAEGFGLPPAEAVLLGVPAVVNDLPVYRESAGNSLIYADSPDMYAWAQIIRSLASEKRADNGAKDRPDRRADLPTWDAHFNLVLRLT